MKTHNVEPDDQANRYTCQVSLNFTLELHVPSFESSDDLKEWLWMHQKQKLLDALNIEYVDNNDNDELNFPQLSEVEEKREEDENKKELEELSKDSKRAQEHLSIGTTRRRADLLNTIASVQRKFFQSESPKVVFGCLLDALLDLMDSEYGFIGEIKFEEDGTMFLQSHAITNIAWNAATRQFYDDNVNQGLKFYNLNTLFGTVMTTKKPVISNRPSDDPRASGIPYGHPPLNHFLGIPFFKPNGEMNGMVGISNKPGGYSSEDIEFLEPFTVTCSNLIQAYWQIEHNQYLINTLEQSVKERTRELEEANANLEEANRQVLKNSQMKLEHFACMSHEIRTPLNCIIGMSSLLKNTPMTPMQTESMKMIVTSGELLLAIVNDVLDYSKLETKHEVDVNITYCSLQDCINAVLHSIQMKARSQNLTLRANLDVALPEFIHTDSRRLQQILYNLLGNAVKFSGDKQEGGAVELVVKIVELEYGNERADRGQNENNIEASEEKKGPISLSLLQQQHSEQQSVGDAVEEPISRCPFHRPPSLKKGVLADLAMEYPMARTINKNSSTRLPGTPKCILRFEVKDNGKGIKKEDFGSIFRPFHQAQNGNSDSVFGGTGLGLAITKKLVEEGLGGSIQVDSEEGKWARFTVDLPIIEAPTEVTSALNGFRVIVVGLGESQHERDTIFRILSSYQAKVEFYDCLADVVREVVLGNGNVCENVFLLHEDGYDQNIIDTLFRSFGEDQHEPTIITFGPKYVVPANKTSCHVRKLDQLIPITLIRAMTKKAQGHWRNDAPTRNPPTGLSKASVSADQLRVLIAEDNTINQKVLQRMLHRIGIKMVDVVENGKLAVDKEAATPYDVVLMDMQMPVMDGLKATSLITGREGGHPKPRVVFVTAHVSPDFEAKCDEVGGSGFLPKPFKIEDIETCFRKVCDDAIKQ